MRLIVLMLMIGHISFGNKNISTRIVDYVHNSTKLSGYLAFDQNSVGSRKPAVIIVHDWNGRDEFENSKAIAVAELGYVGFAVDLYGGVGSNTSENRRLMGQLTKSKEFWLEKLELSLDQVTKLEFVDASKVAAFGFCLGGRSVLEMARNGMNVVGVISFHGSLNTFEPKDTNDTIKAKVLVLHGHADDGITPKAVQEFEEEMTARKADWQVHVYGNNTFHGFTVTNSTRYHPISDKRSWVAMKNFLNEIFDQ